MRANDYWFLVIGLGLVSEVGLNVFLGYKVVSMHHINDSTFLLIAGLMVFTTLLLIATSYATYVLRTELRDTTIQRDLAELELARAQYQSATRYKDASTKVTAISRQLVKHKTSLVNGRS